jgi:hypothetical protein
MRSRRSSRCVLCRSYRPSSFISFASVVLGPVVLFVAVVAFVVRIVLRPSFGRITRRSYRSSLARLVDKKKKGRKGEKRVLYRAFDLSIGASVGRA